MSTYRCVYFVGCRENISLLYSIYAISNVCMYKTDYVTLTRILLFPSNTTCSSIQIGNFLHKTAVLSGVAFLSASLTRAPFASLVLPMGIISVGCAGLYDTLWVHDPLSQYQVCIHSFVGSFLSLHFFLSSPPPTHTHAHSPPLPSVIFFTFPFLSIAPPLEISNAVPLPFHPFPDRPHGRWACQRSCSRALFIVFVCRSCPSRQ